MARPIVIKFGVLRDQAAMHITQVMGGLHLHLRTCRCAILRISETAGRIALKLGVSLETH